MTLKDMTPGIAETGHRVIWRAVFDSGHDYSHWAYPAGTRVGADIEPRPLAVIDPEDAADVIRFANAFGVSTNRAQAALREFAKPSPPKPAEPTGLGAVVVDDEDCRWVRADTESEPWVLVESGGDAWRHWSDLAVSSPDQIKFAGVEA